MGVYLRNDFGHFGTLGHANEYAVGGAFTLEYDFSKLKRSGSAWKQFRDAAKSGVFFGPPTGAGYAMWTLAGLGVKLPWIVEIWDGNPDMIMHGYAGALSNLRHALAPFLNLQGKNLITESNITFGITDSSLHTERLMEPAIWQKHGQYAMHHLEEYFPRKTHMEVLSRRIVFSYALTAGGAKTIRGLLAEAWSKELGDKLTEFIKSPINVTFHKPKPGLSNAPRIIVIGR